jgi:hypothetical protein
MLWVILALIAIGGLVIFGLALRKSKTNAVVLAKPKSHGKGEEETAKPKIHWR